MMEPPKGPRTGCAFDPLLSVGIISVCESGFHHVYCRRLAVRLALGVRCEALGVTWPWSAEMRHVIWAEVGVLRRCRLTTETVIVFNQHLPRALILWSGTSYSLCVFACSSAFDGLPGLILAMQSLSQLSNVSLGGASGRKTPAGKNSWRRNLTVSQRRRVIYVLAQSDIKDTE